MLVLRERLLHVPLMSLQTGTEVGITASAIINPHDLQIMAFYCEGPLIDFEPAILHTSDVREFAPIGMIINSADDIMPPDDLVRLQAVIELKFTLEGKQVVEEGGPKIGKVTNYITDTDSFYIVKLQVKPPLIKSMSVAELLVDRHQIASITKDTIIVKKATSEAPEAATIARQAIQNPFRRTAETSDARQTKG